MMLRKYVFDPKFFNQRNKIQSMVIFYSRVLSFSKIKKCVIKKIICHYYFCTMQTFRARERASNYFWRPDKEEEVSGKIRNTMYIIYTVSMHLPFIHEESISQQSAVHECDEFIKFLDHLQLRLLSESWPIILHECKLLAKNLNPGLPVTYDPDKRFRTRRIFHDETADEMTTFFSEQSLE